jgi:hypothetical protein
MGSSGKKKTTMAKLARENRLRERRLNKQAKKDARKQASFDRPDAGEDRLRDDDTSDPGDEQALAQGDTDEAVRAFLQVDPAPTDPRAKEVALGRLRDAPDEELAVFEGQLQDDALEAGATEREMREAQRNHPGHGA